jgi:L-amino acid N-acyltransferase YncA
LEPLLSQLISDLQANYLADVQNSFVTEDQAPVTEKDWAKMLEDMGRNKLPFIVAVKGPMPVAPLVGISQNRRAPKAILPPSEEIVGFAFAQPFSFGASGLNTGRSRTTLDLQLYVHDQYTRKGIGRSLLDRLVQCLSSGYGAKDGYSWLNPKDDPVYKSGGTQYWHQLIIQYPVKMENDPNQNWMTDFLSKYWFLEEIRLKRMGRTAINTSSILEFLDVILFCHVGTSLAEFPQIV